MRRIRTYWLMTCALLALTFLTLSGARAIAAPAAGYTLTATPGNVDQGGTITISWSRPAGAADGFIGVYFANDFSTLVNFTFPSGTSGSVPMVMPGGDAGEDDPASGTGGYWLRWIVSGDVVAQTFVQVVTPHTAKSTPGYSLSVDPNPVNAGDEFVVHWVKPAGSPAGYIGLYDSTDDHSPLDGTGSFIDFRVPQNGNDTSGDVTFNAPDEPMGYWVAWVGFNDNDYRSIVPFSVAIEGGSPGQPDDEPPTVSLTAPAEGANVAGSITISADADDNVGVTGVQFQLDGNNLGAEVTSAPFEVNWDTTSATNGSRTLNAIARDAAGNHTTSNAVHVTVNNVVVPPGPFAKNSPANGATGLPRVPTISWSASSGATSYEYCVDTSNNNNCDTSWISTASTSASVGGLAGGSTYFWQVRSRNAGGTVEADSNTWWNFTTSSGSHVNVALATNGSVASASSTFGPGYAPSGANNGDRKGVNWSNGGGWNDGTNATWPDWLEIDFPGPQTINEVDVFTVQDNFANPVEPALGMPFTLYGITAFQIQYWDGLSWTVVPGGDITGNNQVWRQVGFGAINTTRIRILVTASLASWSRITEVEAYSDLNIAPGPFSKISPANGAASQSLSPVFNWGSSSGATTYEYCLDTINNNSCDSSWVSTANTTVAGNGLSAGTTYFWQVRARNGSGITEADSGNWFNFTTSSGNHVNVALASNGGVASASSTVNPNYPVSSINNGDRRGIGWANGGGWNDGTENTYPDIVQIDFSGPQAVDEIDVFTLQDNFANPADPTLGMPFTLYGITAFQVQYWDGSSWITVPGGSVSSNNQVWRQFTFAPVTATRIRVVVTGSLASWSRITEVEAYTDLSSAPGAFAKNSPANGAAGQPLVPTLSWNPSTGATSYEYCVDTSNNNVCDSSWVSVSGTSVNVGGLAAGTYFWQVRSRNGAGATEADSGTWRSFATDSSVVNSAANVASAANGATALASSFFSAGYAPAGANDGDRKGVNWGNGGGWNDATTNSYPDSLQINFAGAKSISEIDVFTLQDNYPSPATPTPSMTFTLYGITGFQVQYWDGNNWVNVTGGTISGNTLVWRRFAFSPLTTTAIRINVTGALNGYSRITEVEAY